MRIGPQQEVCVRSLEIDRQGVMRAARFSHFLRIAGVVLYAPAVGPGNRFREIQLMAVVRFNLVAATQVRRAQGVRMRVLQVAAAASVAGTALSASAWASASEALWNGAATSPSVGGSLRHRGGSTIMATSAPGVTAAAAGRASKDSVTVNLATDTGATQPASGQTPPAEAAPPAAGDAKAARSARASKEKDAPPPPRGAHFGTVLISEVMYNPASDESKGQAEWVELVNVSSKPVEIVNWRLDDEDHLPFDQWSAFSCTLPAGGVAVLINGAFVDEAQFRAAWDATDVDAAAEYLVLPVKWGGISNNPGDGNEVLRLLDGENALVCEVALGNGGTWPKLTTAGGPSVYLTQLTETPSDGRLWKASSVELDGGRRVRTTPVFNGPDIGSPGTVPAALLAVVAAPTQKDAGPTSGDKPAGGAPTEGGGSAPAAGAGAAEGAARAPASPAQQK
jgi:hypothetical protein